MMPIVAIGRATFAIDRHHRGMNKLALVHRHEIREFRPL
jgi:hypothetical protein